MEGEVLNEAVVFALIVVHGPDVGTHMAVAACVVDGARGVYGLGDAIYILYHAVIDA